MEWQTIKMKKRSLTNVMWETQVGKVCNHHTWRCIAQNIYVFSNCVRQTIPECLETAFVCEWVKERKSSTEKGSGDEKVQNGRQIGNVKLLLRIEALHTKRCLLLRPARSTCSCITTHWPLGSTTRWRRKLQNVTVTSINYQQHQSHQKPISRSRPGTWDHGYRPPSWVFGNVIGRPNSR